MGRPDKNTVQSLVRELKAADKKLSEAAVEIARHKKDVRLYYSELCKRGVEKSLSEVPIESLNTDSDGINITALKGAGYNTLKDVLGKTQDDFKSVPGIGDVMAEKIVNNASESKSKIEKNFTLRISGDDTSDPAVEGFITELFYQMKVGNIGDDIEAQKSVGQYQILENAPKAEAINVAGIKWFFYSDKTKNERLQAYDTLVKLKESGYIERADDLVSTYNNLKADVNSANAVASFKTNTAPFFALIESLFGKNAVKDEEQVMGLPEDVIKAIEEFKLDTSLMIATLRPYQDFGTRYILCQQRVLLGDEMGLGKTMQAIAAMAHLTAGGLTHFVVVCPVSVMVNWGREIEKHSKLKTITVHGDNRNSLFEEFKEKGGVMITTYETIVRLELENCPKINMLTVDEAHYVKNPSAQRTQALRKLAALSDYCLFMTGTPLENRVDEMVFLISMLRETLSTEIRGMIDVSKAPEFREKISPVYLRRVREDVLKELPEKLESEEWVDMTAKELALYAKALMSKNASFKTRKVSYDVEDIADSSKLTRLLEICAEAKADGRKIIVFSFFRSIIEKVSQALGEDCFGIITGSVPSEERQKIIDEFAKAPDGSVIVSQIIAGGVGLNIQCASVVIICEPQWKPSTENQAISRCYRMGQPRSVLVYRLLSAHSVDEDIMEILREKSNVFDNFADESQIDEVNKKLMEEIVEKERARLGITEADLVDDDDKEDGEYDDQEEDIAKEEISSIIDISENKEGD
ncbi:MAG: DEAD/DEAH box helicase family protein [Clostridiales bacterium]|nr:DEAD/DEAH box helicase family protein [Clostridiales bacterium]